MIDDGALAVVVRQGANGQAITVVTVMKTTGVSVAEASPEQSIHVAPDFGVRADDVTGDDVVDFLVRVVAAATNPGVVTSNDGGAWRLVPISDDPDDTFIGRDPTFSDGRLLSQWNDHHPMCASGTTSVVAWTHDRATGQFRTNGAPQCER